MQIFLARTPGFCAGVARAIDIVEKALAKYGAPLYVFHEIVHNTAVVESFKKRGIIFIDNLNDVPDGDRVIFSAHGIAPEILKIVEKKQLKTLDATCPLVTKVHNEAIRFSQTGKTNPCKIQICAGTRSLQFTHHATAGHRSVKVFYP